MLEDFEIKKGFICSSLFRYYRKQIEKKKIRFKKNRVQLALSPSKKEERQRTSNKKDLAVKKILLPKIVNLVSLISRDFYNIKQSV